MLKASVDLMGGDFAPDIILKAACQFDNVHFVFVGDASARDKIDEYKIKNYTFVESYYVLNEGKKVSKHDLERSSLYFSIMEVKEKRADFVISGGPSGYYLLLCRQLLGTLTNVSRPAIASGVPTQKGSAIMMDLGANMTCTEEDLVKFAIMGVSFAQFWLGVENPQVGFVNVGSEAGKGPEIVKNSASKFESINPAAFGGFVEGTGIMKGGHDVIVCDGFVGNCMIKFGEGAFVFFKEMFKKAVGNNVFYKLLLLIMRNRLKKGFLDPKKYNGAIFAGIDGCAVKSHGGSDEIAFKAALEFGLKISSRKEELFAKMNKDLSAYTSQLQ